MHVPQLPQRPPFVFDVNVIRDSYEKANAICAQVANISQMNNLDEIRVLLEHANKWNAFIQDARDKAWEEYQQTHRFSTYPLIMEPPVEYVKDVIDKIVFRMKEVEIAACPIAARYYAGPDESRICANRIKFSYGIFTTLVQQYCLGEQPTVAAFTTCLKNGDVLCSDWNKMDENGESFGGFWKYPEGSEERENAYTLQGEANQKALLALPFPYRLIRWTIEFGCPRRCESVKFTRECCQWVHEKIIDTGMLDTLEKKIRYDLNCRHELWPAQLNVE
jgi:hypothetical protein